MNTVFHNMNRTREWGTQKRPQNIRLRNEYILWNSMVTNYEVKDLVKFSISFIDFLRRKVNYSVTTAVFQQIKSNGKNVWVLNIFFTELFIPEYTSLTYLRFLFSLQVLLQRIIKCDFQLYRVKRIISNLYLY